MSGINAIRSLSAISRTPGALTSVAGAGLSSPQVFVPSALRLSTKNEDLEKEDPELFWGIFPQLGTYMGLTGVSALAVDILTDPFTYTGFGGLTRAGRAGKVVKALARGGHHVDDVARSIGRVAEIGAQTETRALRTVKGALEGVTERSEALKRLDELGRAGGDTIVGTEERLRALRGAGLSDIRPEPDRFVQLARDRIAKTGRVDEGIRLLDDTIAKRELARQDAAHLIAHGGDPREVTKLLKRIKKNAPSRRMNILLADENLHGIRDAIHLERAGKTVDPLIKGSFRRLTEKELAKKGLEGGISRSSRELAEEAGTGIIPYGRDLSEAGRRQLFERTAGTQLTQRSMVQIKVPFTDLQLDFVVGQNLIGGTKVGNTLLKGLEAVGGLEKGRILKGARVGLVPGAKTFNAIEASRQGRSAADVDTIVGVARKQRDFAKRNIQETLAPGESARGAAENYLGERAVFDMFAETSVRELTESIGAKFGRSKLTSGLSEKAKNALLLIQDIADNTTAYVDLPTVDVPDPRRIGRGTILGAPKRRLVQRAEELGFSPAELDEVLRHVDAVTQMFDEIGATALEEGVIKGTVTHYFPRMVAKVLDEGRFTRAMTGDTVKNRISTWTKSGMPRTIPNLDELRRLEAEGVVEITEKDPVKLLEKYIQGIGRAISAQRLQKQLYSTRVPAAADTLKNVDHTAMVPLMTAVDDKAVKAHPKSYETVTDQGMVSLFNEIGEKYEIGKWKGARSVAVHKDVARPLAIAMETENVLAGGQTLTQRTLGRMATINGALKRTLLGASAFHMMALTESAVAQLGWEFLRQPKIVATAFARQYHHATDIAQHAVQSGLQMGHMLDAEIGSFARMVKFVEDRVPGTQAAGRALRGGLAGTVGRWDRTLWDYYHNGLKLHAWNELYHQALVKFPNRNRDQIAKAVSEHVNNSFGGQNWERLMVSKKGMQYARLLALSPDWNVSNLRVAADIYGNWFKRQEMVQRGLGQYGWKVQPEDLLRADVRSYFALQYAKRAGLIYAANLQLVNHALSGRFMFENPAGRELQVDLGSEDDEGRRLYWSPGKQFLEPYEITRHPWQFVKNKTAFWPKLAATIWTGNDWKGDPILAHKDGLLDGGMKLIGHHAFNTLPIPIQNAIRKEPNAGIRAVFGALGAPTRREGRTERRERIRAQRQNSGSTVDIPPDLIESFERIEPAIRRAERQLGDVRAVNLPVAPGF